MEAHQSEENPSEAFANSGALAKPKTKNYACTPRQLEALRKAREAKRMRSSEAKRQTQGPIFSTDARQHSEEEFRDARVEDMRHVWLLKQKSSMIQCKWCVTTNYSRNFSRQRE